MQADVGWVEQELNEVRGDCRVLKEERDEARADYAKLLESSTAVADNLREDIRQLRSQLEADRAQLEADRAQLEADRAQVEAELKKQLDLMPTENHQDYDQLLESSSATIDNQRKVVALLQSRLREEREKFEAQLAELQQRLDAAEQNPDSAIDLSGKAGEVVNFFRTLLPKDTKLPKNTMTKLREILETTED
ncbi:hypothetical protein QT979_23075 [Microcoleus sp. w2-18bC1]|uniref:hypothetical protein n=1 Tax=unclassified Microcoleus TaxID=2642155 RepID=UPI002FCFF3E1